MIARVWHGYTTPEHADAYESMLKPELLGPEPSTSGGDRFAWIVTEPVKR